MATHFLLFLAVFFVSSSSLASARDHIVGRDYGWTTNVNYTLWSDNQTFYVNDLISFRYPKTGQYNVLEVNKTGYDNCTTDGLSGSWSSGKDFITLDSPRTYYFICGSQWLCQGGMKVAVLVHPNSSSPAMSPTESKPGSSDPDAPRIQGFSAFVLLLLTAYCCYWI